MKDTDIIKALECCGKNPPICIECSYKGKCNRKDCYDYLKSDALDLINRQKARIEFVISSQNFAKATANKLKTELDLAKAFHREAVAERDLLNIQLKEAKAEVERLKKLLDDKCDRCITKDKAEAVKECFEKVKKRLAVHSFTSNSTEYTDGQLDCMLWVDSEIYELEKEMVGVDNA